MSEERSKYPIADLGDHFEPDAMEDFDRRSNAGEFDGKTIEEIRRIYVDEEMDQVEERENLEMLREEDERAEREADLDD